MPNIVRIPYSNTAGNTPASLLNGQIGVNQSDGKLFYRNSSGVVTQLSSSSIASYATTASFPASGNSSLLYLATDTGKVYQWSNAYSEIGSVGGSVADTRWDLFLPAAPTSVTATTGNTQATVSWTASAGVVSQAPLTNYVLQYSTNSGSSWTTVSRSASTATSATVTGLTNGTAYTFRAAGVNAVGTGSYSTASNSVTPAAGDAYWTSVQLLLPGDTSTADVSSYSRAVTVGGSAAVSTAQKKWGAGSILFSSATGDYLQLADLDALELLAGDFVIEFWVLTTNSTQYATLVSRSPGAYGSGAWSLLMNSASTTSGDLALYAGDLGSPILQSSGISLRDGSWHHVAVSRASSSLSLYVDGTRVGTGTSSATIANIAGGIRIGADQYYGRYFSGYIDDFRLTVGQNRGYTGATVTVPAAAFTAF